jgi:hypothetical protein
MRSVLGLGLVVVLSIAIFLFASLAFAQGGATGAITGTVQDPTARPKPAWATRSTSR